MSSDRPTDRCPTRSMGPAACRRSQLPRTPATARETAQGRGIVLSCLACSLLALATPRPRQATHVARQPRPAKARRKPSQFREVRRPGPGTPWPKSGSPCAPGSRHVHIEQADGRRWAADGRSDVYRRRARAASGGQAHLAERVSGTTRGRWMHTRDLPAAQALRHLAARARNATFQRADAALSRRSGHCRRHALLARTPVRDAELGMMIDVVEPHARSPHRLTSSPVITAVCPPRRSDSTHSDVHVRVARLYTLFAERRAAWPEGPRSTHIPQHMRRDSCSSKQF